MSSASAPQETQAPLSLGLFSKANTVQVPKQSPATNMARPVDEPTDLLLAEMDMIFRDISGDGLLKKRIIARGNGTQLSRGTLMKIHYQIFNFDSAGKLEAEPFDNSWARLVEDGTKDKDPIIPVPRSYVLMTGEVIGALDYGVLTMEVGERAELLARGPYAYGTFGVPDVVGPNAPVLVRVVVLEGLEPTVVRMIIRGFIKNKTEVGLEDAYEAGKEWRRLGNEAYRKADWENALKHYKAAVSWILGSPVMTQRDVKRFDALLFGLYSNIAGVHLVLKAFEKTIRYCGKGLEVRGDVRTYGEHPSKIYYRLAAAHYELKQYDKAIDACQNARTLEPHNPTIVALYARLRDITLAAEERVDQMRKNMSKAFV